jgi:hypothetical protein
LGGGEIEITTVPHPNIQDGSNWVTPEGIFLPEDSIFEPGTMYDIRDA